VRYVDWRIRGPSLETCNCAWVALASSALCPPMAIAGALQVDQGHFGEVELDGLHCAWLCAWPGPIHEGDGVCQLVVDERADERQRAAPTWPSSPVRRPCPERPSSTLHLTLSGPVT
jgi:hypothetical protein